MRLFLQSAATKQAEEGKMQSNEADLISRIPTVSEIREKMIRNSRENRLLRSLYNLAKKLAKEQSSATNRGTGVVSAG